MTRERDSVWTIYLMALLLSACSLVYELLIAQTVSLLSANTVIWYSVTVGCYLGAMGVGTLLYESRFAGADSDPWRQFFLVEIGLTAVGALAVVVIQFGHVTFLLLSAEEFPAIHPKAAFFGSVFTMILAVGFLTGLELPLLIRLGNKLARRRVSNRVLGADYLGALLGGVAFPLLLLPNLELVAIGLGTAVLNLLAAVYLLLRFIRRDLHDGLRALGVAAVALGLLLGLLNLRPIEQYFLKKYYYYLEVPDDVVSFYGSWAQFPYVRRYASPYQKIDMVHDPAGFDSDVVIGAYSSKFRKNPEFPANQVLFLNGDFQLLSNYEDIYHENFAHVPILLSADLPRKVLVMGAGDGLLIKELLKHQGIEQITHVDLDPVLVDLARSDPILTAMNERALDDPRVQTLLGDAFQYARVSEEVFDAIYLDFPSIRDYNLSKLYSREFFQFVRGLIAPGGFMVFDAPSLDSARDEDGGVEVDPEDPYFWEVYQHTLSAAGYATLQPYVSYIETNNPEAFEILARIDEQYDFAEDETESERLEERIEFLREHAESLQQAFIMAWPESHAVEPSWRELDVELHALNEARFYGALSMAYAEIEEVDMDMVNSIMRPTLPAGSVWFVRTAW